MSTTEFHEAGKLIARYLPGLAKEIYGRHIILKNGDRSSAMLNDGVDPEAAWLIINMEVGSPAGEEYWSLPEKEYNKLEEHYVELVASEPSEGFTEFQLECLEELGFEESEHASWLWTIEAHRALYPPTFKDFQTMTAVVLAAAAAVYNENVEALGWELGGIRNPGQEAKEIFESMNYDPGS